ncbi:putative SNARE protein [Besnoitia besnoiti]|uniref:Putative SNARE protein n=1 Tax=Besnoitia besnoiti TaxID=94643 RepID=A0A2A9MI21_BESBE|nr:putative SNARE protein [Besnoitia besnoiti]PFH35901.1 putative SNARE protein [Besnoitia besnoiti]
MASAAAWSLASLYPACIACRKQIDALVASCEASGPGGPSGLSAFEAGGAPKASVATQQRLVALTRQLERDLARLDAAFESERAALAPQQASLWRRRLAALHEDAQALQSAVDVQLGSVYRRQVEEKRQREALLDGRQREAERTREAELSYARERDKLHESHTMLDAVLAEGRGVLDKMVQQNSILKTAKRKILDMSTSAGLSASIIGAVTRRQATDRKIVFAGMLATLLFFFLLYRFFHSGSAGSAEPTDASGDGAWASDAAAAARRLDAADAATASGEAGWAAGAPGDYGR